MGRPGRKRKAGARTKTDRLSRAGQPPLFVPPSDWVKAQRERFGMHYSTALGRAFAAGLLGSEQEANDRYAEAKRFARVYARMIDQDRYRCALDRSPRGSSMSDVEDPDQIELERMNKEWLFEAMDKIDLTGCRPYLDQLISKLHTDRGPYWLDNILAGGQHPADIAVLEAALKAIDAIVPVRPNRIRAA